MKSNAFLSLCPLLQANQNLITSLGYIDTEYNTPSTQQTVASLVNSEMKTFKPSTTYLDYLPDYTPTFAGDIRLQNEYKRVKANVPLRAIDMNRYQPKEPTGKEANSEEAWSKAIRQQQVALAYHTNHIINLELHQNYGPQIGRVKTNVVDGLVSQIKQELDQVQDQIQQINAKRKHHQLLNAEKLQIYEEKYNDLCARNAILQQVLQTENERALKKLKTKESTEDIL